MQGSSWVVVVEPVPGARDADDPASSVGLGQCHVQAYQMIIALNTKLTIIKKLS